MSKFSDQVAQGMSEILENKSFYKPFNKIAQSQAFESGANPDDFGLEELSRWGAPFEYLPAEWKNKSDIRFSHPGDNFIAQDSSGNIYIFNHSNNSWESYHGQVVASFDAQNFEVYAAKKKKDDEDDDKDDKKDKKSDKKDKSDKKSKKDEKDEKDDEEEDDKDDKKSKKKKSKKDEDKNDAVALIFAAKKSKEDKKDGEEKVEKSDDKDDKKDKPKGKKKQFPFWLKKKKAGENCKPECDCDECMEANDGMFASAIRHIVESFTKTSVALDNMGLEKSSIATMAILDHIINEAASVKVAKESTPLEEKLKNLKDKFKKMHEKDEAYDADVAEELDKKITEIEDQIKAEKKNKDSNDVRHTDLLLGLDDPEAREGFLDHNLDDPHSSAALEEILTKNPGLVDEIAPRLKSQFGEQALEDQLKERIKSRLPSIIPTPNKDSDFDSIMNYERGIPQENSEFSEIMKAYNPQIPNNAKLPDDFVERRIDPNRTKIDELNAKDGMDEDELIDKMVKELQKNFVDYDDSGEIDCTHLAEEMADKLGLLEGDEDKVPDYVFECATEAAEKYENMHSKDEDDDSNDITAAFNLVDQWVKSAEGNFEDDSDSTVTHDDLKSILDVIGEYSQKDINDREEAMVPSKLDSFADEYLNMVK